MDDASVASRLNRLPIVRTHRAVALIVGIGAFFDLFDIFLAGVLGRVLTDHFHLGRNLLPAVIGSAFLGMFVGATALGMMADRIGRRTAFMLNLGVYSAFTLAGAFSLNAEMLIASRFLAGIGIGAELPLCDAYLSEMLPARHRGRYTAIAYTLGFLGVPAVGFLARALVPIAPFGIEGWRWLFAVGSLGAAIVWLLRSRLPESPRWLDLKGRTKEADAIVAAMEAEAVATGAALAWAAPGHEPPIQTAAPIAVLFSDEYRRRTLMLWVFQIFQPFGYYGFGTIVPTVLAAKGFTIVTSLTYTSLAFVGYPVGSALSIPIVERIDRKWLIVASAGAMAVFGLALGMSTYGPQIVVLGFCYTLVSNIFSNAFHIFQAEIFPTGVRATAAGTAYGLSRLSSAAMPFLLLPVLNALGPTAMFSIVGMAMLIVMVNVGAFAPSTTGRTLEDVNTVKPARRDKANIRTV